ncbi:MAG TPA: type II toxin-antitoxin system ParD family antitoxin [Pirellulales bacterium]|jgi:Arc/MetJ-type ribon-helix-helix transcriptional regulator|nr:type II toxin-antitoxin system ParD family antitoxin [Pirellulales bacterium]
MTYSFSPEIERQIDYQMALGKYTTADDLLRDALNALAERREDIAAVQAGLEDMEAGRVRPLTEVAAEIRATRFPAGR